MALCVSFPPVCRRDARLLILGSLPGVESLEKGQYYAKKQNSFWRIMGDLWQAGPLLSYAERLKRLKANKIALWDVCASAERRGSLDSNIELTTIVPNDLAGFFLRHKEIRLIGFNGQPAAKLFERTVLPHLPPPAAALQRVILPSTSPAHARLRYEEKLHIWRRHLFV